MNFISSVGCNAASELVGKEAFPEKKISINGGSPLLVSLNSIGDDIYTLVQAMYLLAKRVRDLLQDYNQKQQSYGWQIRTLAINKKIDAINTTKGAGELTGAGSIIGGVAGILLGVGTASSAFAGPANQMIDSAFGIRSAAVIADADINKQRADLVEVNANNYLQSLDSVSAKSTEIMERLFEFARSITALKAQIMGAVKI
ncbi:MAG: hypothetical protein ACRC9O_02320 [Plesiomonas sp.]|uniref:hypothetical protein n=1 Tax=Plesiomonas sp. TaxID=2486279 RepID=UPI003F2C989C